VIGKIAVETIEDSANHLTKLYFIGRFHHGSKC
jgi:hypothetical protein